MRVENLKGSSGFLDTRFEHPPATIQNVPISTPLTRESGRLQRPFRMPQFLFLDIPRYVIRIENQNSASDADPSNYLLDGKKQWRYPFIVSISTLP